MSKKEYEVFVDEDGYTLYVAGMNWHRLFSSMKTAESTLKKFFNPETLQQLEAAVEKSARPSSPIRGIRRVFRRRI